MDDNNRASKGIITFRLYRLQTEFQQVAEDARKVKFFDSWFEDKEARVEEYAAYAQRAGSAINLLCEDKVDAAMSSVTNLKEAFDTKAGALRKKSRAFFASWFNGEEREARQLERYSQELGQLLKFVQKQPKP